MISVALPQNSQAGPHNYINSLTRRLCNSIYSRSYNLTRHEGTIYNVRKRKVRYQLYTEENMFSQKVALIKYTRVTSLPT